MGLRVINVLFEAGWDSRSSCSEDDVYTRISHDGLAQFTHFQSKSGGEVH